MVYATAVNKSDQNLRSTCVSCLSQPIHLRGMDKWTDHREVIPVCQPAHAGDRNNVAKENYKSKKAER